MGYWNTINKGVEEAAKAQGIDSGVMFKNVAGNQIEAALNSKIMEPDERAKQRYRLAEAAGLAMPGLDGALQTPLGFANGGKVGKKCLKDGGPKTRSRSRSLARTSRSPTAKRR